MDNLEKITVAIDCVLDMQERSGETDTQYVPSYDKLQSVIEYLEELLNKEYEGGE